MKIIPQLTVFLTLQCALFSNAALFMKAEDEYVKNIFNRLRQNVERTQSKLEELPFVFLEIDETASMTIDGERAMIEEEMFGDEITETEADDIINLENETKISNEEPVSSMKHDSYDNIGVGDDSEVNGFNMPQFSSEKSEIKTSEKENTGWYLPGSNGQFSSPGLDISGRNFVPSYGAQAPAFPGTNGMPNIGQPSIVTSDVTSIRNSNPYISQGSDAATQYHQAALLSHLASGNNEEANKAMANLLLTNKMPGNDANNNLATILLMKSLNKDSEKVNGKTANKDKSVGSSSDDNMLPLLLASMNNDNISMNPALMHLLINRQSGDSSTDLLPLLLASGVGKNYIGSQVPTTTSSESAGKASTFNPNLLNAILHNGKGEGGGIDPLLLTSLSNGNSGRLDANTAWAISMMNKSDNGESKVDPALIAMLSNGGLNQGANIRPELLAALLSHQNDKSSNSGSAKTDISKSSGGGNDSLFSQLLMMSALNSGVNNLPPAYWTSLLSEGDKKKGDTKNNDNSPSISPLLWLAAMNGQGSNFPPGVWSAILSTTSTSSTSRGNGDKKDDKANQSSLDLLPYLLSTMSQSSMSGIGNVAASQNTQPGMSVLNGGGNNNNMGLPPFPPPLPGNNPFSTNYPPPVSRTSPPHQNLPNPITNRFPEQSDASSHSITSFSSDRLGPNQNPIAVSGY